MCVCVCVCMVCVCGMCVCSVCAGFSLDRKYMTFIVWWAISWFASTKALALTTASASLDNSKRWP